MKDFEIRYQVDPTSIRQWHCSPVVLPGDKPVHKTALLVVHIPALECIGQQLYKLYHRDLGRCVENSTESRVLLANTQLAKGSTEGYVENCYGEATEPHNYQFAIAYEGISRCNYLIERLL